MHVLEIMKQVGKKWQNLDPVERKIYQDKADLDKIRYQKQLKDFEKEVDKLGLEKNVKSGERKIRKKKTSTTTANHPQFSGAKRKARGHGVDINDPQK